MELLHAVLTDLFIEMNNYLGIGVCMEPVPFRLQLQTESLIIVDFPIVDHP
jgi:hypothetical protein